MWPALVDDALSSPPRSPARSMAIKASTEGSRLHKVPTFDGAQVRPGLRDMRLERFHLRCVCARRCPAYRRGAVPWPNFAQRAGGERPEASLDAPSNMA